MADAIHQLVQGLTDNAADGTGIVEVEKLTHQLLPPGTEIPQYLIDYVQDQQWAQFGSYPDSKDVAPSAIFTALFAIISLLYLAIFIKNITIGHKFYVTGLCFLYATMRWLGFALRIVWAQDILKVHTGIASEVLLVLPTILLSSINCILAQRLFTWKHPVLGNNKFFWNIMLLIYAVVVAVFIMTVVASAVPYLYLLSRSHYNMCRNVVKVSSLLIVLYSLLAFIFLGIAYIFPTGKREKDALVYQPFWVKSFSPFYFPSKGASKHGQDLFLNKHKSDSRVAMRTIPGGNLTTINYEAQTEEEELENYEAAGAKIFDLKHNMSIVLITVTTVFVFVGALLRCICMFIDTTFAEQGAIFAPSVMYVFFGALEVITSALYIFGRIDLRFYRPDAITKKCLAAFENNSESSELDNKETSTASSV